MDPSNRLPDPFDLKRFVTAQQNTWQQALKELLNGRKTSHWMWYIFPQVYGLGFSAVSKRFAIRNLDEAMAYLAHPLLGERLIICSKAVLDVKGRTATQIFGYPDDLKLRSCMTLFAKTDAPDSVFDQVLKKYYGGRPDHRTLDLI